MIIIDFYGEKFERSGDTIILRAGINSIRIPLDSVAKVQADYKMNVLRCVLHLKDPEFFAEFNFSDSEKLEMFVNEFFDNMAVEVRE